MDESDTRGLVVVAGEALVDLVPSGDGLRAHPGGGPFNVARAVARLGAPAAFLGRLSTDRFGVLLRDALERDGVRLDCAVGTEDPTTLALAEVGEDGGATYRFYVEGTSAPGLDGGVALPGDTTMLVVGTLGLVFEPSATTLERLVAEAPQDVLVAVDPNVRPAAIADPAAYRARLARILARADVVKASAEDLAWLVPDAATPAAALRTLLAPHAAGVATLGAAGAVVVAPGGDPIAVSAPPIVVADTIGAGDAFLGGLLAHGHRQGRRRAELADPATLREAAAFATRVAAATCERPGADPPTAAQM
jgi:fructokinase